MRKLTRRSYNRKLLVLGASMFTAVAMISTGFAAWVMSAVTNADVDAPVHVGVVTDASMEVIVDQWENGEWKGDILTFDAPQNDRGRVYASEDTLGEKLSLKITGKVTNADPSLGRLTITIKLPESLTNAIDKGYIKVVEQENQNYAKIEGKGVVTYVVEDGQSLLDDEVVEKAKTFEYMFQLAWGDEFDGVNPAVFYDSTEHFRDDTAGKDIGDDVVKSDMNEFELIMHGATEDPQAPYSGTIDIVVEATVKA